MQVNMYDVFMYARMYLDKYICMEEGRTKTKIVMMLGKWVAIFTLCFILMNYFYIINFNIR
jgi:hypothetical protein